MASIISKNLLIAPILLTLFFMANSCITTSDSSEELRFTINILDNNPFLNSSDISILFGQLNQKDSNIEAIFNSKRGGTRHNIILGTTTIMDANDGLRFSVSCAEKEVVKFTPNQIKKWDIIDGVYIAPPFCEN